MSQGLQITFISCSLISQLNMDGLSFLYCSIFDSISALLTLGLLPPIAPGFIEPVSWYLRTKMYVSRDLV